MAKNNAGKLRPASNPYEIWGRSPSMPGWDWHVLKKWQADDNKPLGRWFCRVVTPIVPEGEMGDVYVSDIKDVAGAVLVCKGCGRALETDMVRNALSRYEHGYICSGCGTREAMEGDFIKVKFSVYGV